MTIQDQITADQQAVADAQLALDQAQQQLQKDQDALNAIQPHLSMWQEVEATAQKYGGEVEAEFMGSVSKAKAFLNI